MKAAEYLALTAKRTGKSSRKGKSSGDTSPEDLFAFHCMVRGLPGGVTQHLFAKSIERNWRFDFAWPHPEFMLAVEIEGLVVKRLAGQLVCTGRHASITGYKEDNIKYASANILGWHVLRFEQSQVKSGVAVDMTAQFLKSRGWTEQP